MRYLIRENQNRLINILDSFLPNQPKTKNWSYNSFKELNKYMLFVNDESIMHYPPARTYEGTACGTVMICSNHPVYEEFGWIDKENSIKFEYGNINDFETKLKIALNDNDFLNILHKNTLKHAAMFSHKRIAYNLFNHILNLLGENGFNDNIYLK